MSADEAWAVLARAHTGVLTSLRRDGTPISLPVWFAVLDRRIYVSGPAHTKKFARIRHDPRVSFLVESGELWAELVGVHVTGRAQNVDDVTLRERVAAALHEKYSRFRTPREDMPDATRAQYETAVTTIEIVPDQRMLSSEGAIGPSSKRYSSGSKTSTATSTQASSRRRTPPYAPACAAGRNPRSVDRQ